jgi:hypothetical protein
VPATGCSTSVAADLTSDRVQLIAAAAIAEVGLHLQYARVSDFINTQKSNIGTANNSKSTTP